MRKIKQFLLSLMGKGWLWGAGTVSYGKFFELDSLPHKILKQEEEKCLPLAVAQACNPILERWIIATDPHDKEELTEIDFMCAWLDLMGDLPQNSTVRTDKEGIWVRSNESLDYVWLSYEHGYRNDYKKNDLPKYTIAEFIDSHGIRNLKWMFKSVTTL